MSSHALSTVDPTGKRVLSDKDIARIINRIAHQVLEKTHGGSDVILLGIPSRGVPLAARLAERISIFGEIDMPCGSLDTTLYRDDLRIRGARPLHPTDVPATGVDNKCVILVDDVLYSGRTVRAALNALYDLGRPSRVQLAVLVDRGHRELPIRADYVGKNIPTSASENVSVLLSELDGADAVVLSRGGEDK